MVQTAVPGQPPDVAKDVVPEDAGAVQAAQRDRDHRRKQLRRRILIRVLALVALLGLW